MSEDCQHDKAYRYAHYEQRKLGRVTVQFCIACAYKQITQQLKAQSTSKALESSNTPAAQ